MAHAVAWPRLAPEKLESYDELFLKQALLSTQCTVVATYERITVPTAQLSAPRYEKLPFSLSASIKKYANNLITVANLTAI